MDRSRFGQGRLIDAERRLYLSEGTLAALEAIQQATGEREVNAIGYCIGGTLLFCTLAYLAAIQDPRIHSATALTTLIDFTEVGELGVFIDEEQLARLDKKMERRGRSVYAGAHLPAGPVTFVLGESGHIAGVINPPVARKYGYRTQAELPATPEAWLETATSHPGSWWVHWLDWIQPYAGPQVRARVPGDGGLQPLEAAPGSYVKVAGIE